MGRKKEKKKLFIKVENVLGLNSQQLLLFAARRLSCRPIGARPLIVTATICLHGGGGGEPETGVYLQCERGSEGPTSSRR